MFNNFHSSRGLSRWMALGILVLFFVLFIILLYIFRPKSIGKHQIPSVKFLIHLQSGDKAKMGIELGDPNIKYSQGVSYPLPVTTYKDGRHQIPVSVQIDDEVKIESCAVEKMGELKVVSNEKRASATVNFPSLEIEPPRCPQDPALISYSISRSVMTHEGQKIFRHQLKPNTGAFGFRRAGIEFKTVDPLAYLKPKIDVYTIENGKRKRITGKLKVLDGYRIGVELEKPLYAPQVVWFEAKWTDPRGLG